MTDVEQRVAAVEMRLESALALDARLKSIESEVRKLRSSGLREWIQTLAPYISGVLVIFFGWWIKDSVTFAMQREQLDLEYVKQMRDLIKDFDEASTQTAADANAVGLAMYGKHAIMPLVERLEGGDIAPLAAERGLRLVGSEHAEASCPKFLEVINDRARRFKWQTHKALIRVIGQSACGNAGSDLQNYRTALQQLSADENGLSTFAQRYSQKEGFDAESVAALVREIDRALEILSSQVKT